MQHVHILNPPCVPCEFARVLPFTTSATAASDSERRGAFIQATLVESGAMVKWEGNEYRPRRRRPHPRAPQCLRLHLFICLLAVCRGGRFTHPDRGYLCTFYSLPPSNRTCEFSISFWKTEAGDSYILVSLPTAIPAWGERKRRTKKNQRSSVTFPKLDFPSSAPSFRSFPFQDRDSSFVLPHLLILGQVFPGQQFPASSCSIVTAPSTPSFPDPGEASLGFLSLFHDFFPTSPVQHDVLQATNHSQAFGFRHDRENPPATIGNYTHLY